MQWSPIQKKIKAWHIVIGLVSSKWCYIPRINGVSLGLYMSRDRKEHDFFLLTNNVEFLECEVGPQVYFLTG